MMTPTQLQNLVHAFELLEGIEQRIDRRLVSRGSYAAALRSMGEELDQALSLLASHGMKPDTLELLIACFHPQSKGVRHG